MLHLTNLNPRSLPKGIHFACCVRPQDDIPADARYVLIDHEADNDAIREGHRDAIDKAKSVIAGVRGKAAGAQVGWYGWPFVMDEDDLEANAVAFKPLLELADFLAPCCYVGSATDENTEFRGHLFDECIGRMNSSRVLFMERIGVVCDWTLDSKHKCDDGQVAEQVSAANRADCDAIYVWSGLPYRVWAASLNVPFGHAAYDAVNRARGELLGTYGFRLRKWSSATIAAEYQREANRVANRFLREWNEQAI